jgi:UDP-N-acetylglucosamine 2-epimerase (non-hydrolysing)
MKIAVVFGTRPEVIKLAPVIARLRKSDRLQTAVICTGQHREMIDDVCAWFGIKPDIDLHLMKPAQSLSGFLSAAIMGLDAALSHIRPQAVLVQGDTASALAGAISGFHQSLPIGHVEAGLRTDNIKAPFPEEANRAMLSRIAAWNFAPTERAVNALRAEKVPGAICKTGNTVVDALLATRERLGEPALAAQPRRLVLVTAHRRENFGDRFEAAFTAIDTLAARYPDTDFVYPLHLNPRIQEHARRALGGRGNVRLVQHLPYPDMIALMRSAYLILTDSGGIQEEAPSLGVPVLVMRDTTERQEAVEAGVARLVGTDPDTIMFNACELLDDSAKRDAIAAIPNPFGDGYASDRIVAFVEKELAR